jgi:hypothetical protein
MFGKNKESGRDTGGTEETTTAGCDERYNSSIFLTVDVQ